MKKCNVCNKEYDDSKMFCPVCGGQLTSGTPTPTPNFKPAPQQTNTSPSWFENWGGILLGVIGLVVAWVLSAMLGAALAILGIIVAWKSPNNVNKIASIVVGVITVLLFIMVLVVNL